MDRDVAARRGTRVLFGSVALGTTTFFAVSSVAPVIAEDLIGSASWSGLPGAASLLGVGSGAGVIGRVMARSGRRPGLVVGYAMGVVGALACVLAVDDGNFPAFVAGMFVLGWGHSANQLARYAAADLHPIERRATGIAIVVWAATLGAVVGPNLLDVFGGLAELLALPALVGPHLAGLGLLGAAGAVVFAGLRPDPSVVAVAPAVDAGDGAPGPRPWLAPHVQIALVALVGSQTVMVLVMSMTPLHIAASGHGLSMIGFVMSGHFAGMYALSPVAGRVSDRAGRLPAIAIGLLLLLLSAALAGSGLVAGLWLLAPLFLLGLGWSFAFVASSALLTEGMPFAVRARLQGTADTLAWVSAAVASSGAGLVFDRAGFEILALLGAALVAAPLTFVMVRRRAVPAV